MNATFVLDESQDLGSTLFSQHVRELPSSPQAPPAISAREARSALPASLIVKPTAASASLRFGLTTSGCASRAAASASPEQSSRAILPSECRSRISVA